MDKTLNKILMVIVFALIFDAMSFSLSVEKTQFNLVSGMITTGKKAVELVRLVK